MGRPRLHGAGTRAELLRAAEGLVETGGPEAVTVRRLAAKVGTTTRAIYSVFGDKDSLFNALTHEALAKLLATVQAVPLTDDPVHDLVRAGVEGFRNYTHRYPNLFRFVFESGVLKNPGPENMEIALESLQALRSRVDRCAQAHRIPPDSVDTLTSVFHSLCVGLATVERAACLPLPMGNEPEEVWEAALQGLIAGFAHSVRSSEHPWPRSEWPPV